MRYRISAILLVLGGWMMNQPAMGAESKRPGAGRGGIVTPGSAAGAVAPRAAVKPSRALPSLLSADDLAVAQRLEDTLQDLLVESLQRGGSTFDVRGYAIGGLTPYSDVFLLKGPDPIVDITIGGGPDGYSDRKLRDAATGLKGTPGVRVLGVASAVGHGVISAAVEPPQLLRVAGMPGVAQVNASGAMTGRVKAGAGDGVEDLLLEIERGIALLGQGAVTSQAEEALDVDDARRVFNPNGDDPDGDGIDIGTLSDSVNQVNGIAGDGLVGIAESQNTGDLPPDGQILVLNDYTGTDATDEGRAMMEHVYDIATASSRLGFASAFLGLATFAANITALGANGMDIINDDVVYFDEPYYQDGVVAQAVNNYVNGGGVYFSLNHNYANLSYEGVWANADGDQYHEYVPSASGGDEVLLVSLANNARLRLGLQWTQPWGAANTDLKIELWNSTITAKLAESTTNNRGGNPYDSLSYLNSTGGTLTLYIAVSYVSHAGDTPPTGLTLKFIAFDNGASRVSFLEHTDAAAGTLTPHAGTPQSISIGAAPFYSRDAAEYFSGRGPHRRFFTAGGSPTGPFTFTKPDFLAIDACNTTFFGGDIAQDADTRPNFFGTSAATPHAAAVAALMLDVAGGPGTLDQEDIRDLMRRTAVDLGTAGHDTTYGHGRINALGAVAAARGPLSAEYSLYPNQFGDVSFDQNLSSESDIDRFEFALDVSGSCQIDTVEGHADMDPMMVLFRQSDSAFMAADYNGGSGDDSRITFSGVAGAVYTIGTFSETAFTGSADFTISVNGPSAGVASLLLDTFGDVTYNGNLYSGADLDYFRLTAPGDVTGGLTVTCQPTGFDSYLILFDSAGAELARNNWGGSGAADTITYAGPVAAARQFVVLVASSGYSTCGDFVLTANFENAPGQPATLSPFPASVAFTVRPNPVTGAFSYTYPAMDAGQSVNSLWVPNAASQSVAASTGHFLDSITGGLYNASGSRLAVSGPGNSIVLNAAAPVSDGSRYIYRHYGAADLGIIILPRVQTITSWATFTEFPAPADTISPVTLITSGTGYVYAQTVGFRVQTAGDQDYFEIVPPANATGGMAITMTMNSALDGMFELYDSAGTLLVGRNTGGSGATESCAHSPITPGATYYIRATNADGSVDFSDTTQSGDYTLRVEIPINVPTPTPGPPTPTQTPPPGPTLTPTPTPQLIDGDGDGFRDDYEVLHGSNPDDPDSVPMNLDIDGDGDVDVDDAVALYKYVTGANPSAPGVAYNTMDFDEDGRITVVDAILLYRNRAKRTPPVIPVLP